LTLPNPNNGVALTVLNLKGGVGKTHTCWLLASVCQERNRRLLAVDLDTQGNLSNSFRDADDGRPGLEALFDPGAETDPASLVRASAFSAIDFLPADARLAKYDLSDQHAWERADLHLSLVDPVAQLRGDFEYVVISPGNSVWLVPKGCVGCPESACGWSRSDV
jgi:cellulose biosynthesis protein BcsQ